MSAQPNQPKRPWILRGQGKSYRTGLWGRWRAFGTYATEEKAQAALQRAQSMWGASGQFYVVHKEATGLPPVPQSAPGTQS